MRRVSCSNINQFNKKRLLNADGSMREYDYVVFARGYDSDRQRFLAKFKGTSIVDEVEEQHKKFVDPAKFPRRKQGYFCIDFGPPMVLATGVVTTCSTRRDKIPASSSTRSTTRRGQPQVPRRKCARIRPSRVRRAMFV